MCWVACGSQKLPVQVPSTWAVTKVFPPSLPPPDRDTIFTQAVTRLSLSIRSLYPSAPPEDAVIVVPDISRPGPESMLLPKVLNALQTCGITRITGIIGNGLHRAMTPEEIQARYGHVSSVIPFKNHDAKAKNLICRLGFTQEGIPIALNREVVKASLVISTGLIEPHQYAGYSGGFKTVAIGTAGEATISATHSPRFLNLKGVAIGNLRGNPFQNVLRQIADKVGPTLCINYVLDQDKKVQYCAAGPPGATQSQLTKQLTDLFFEPVKPGFDVIIAGTPHPKSSNLYHTTRSATYLVANETNLLKQGGTIIVASPCEEGIGKGTGELRFYKALTSTHNPKELVQHLLTRPTQGGEQRAWMVARILQHYKLIIAESRLSKSSLENAGLGWAETLEEAIQAQYELTPYARCLIVADPFRRLPIITAG